MKVGEKDDGNGLRATLRNPSDCSVLSHSLNMDYTAHSVRPNRLTPTSYSPIPLGEIMNPHNKKKTIRSKYNATADFYNNRYRNIQYEKYSRMLNSMELKGMILDLGSGTGMLSDFLDKEVIGVDFSINMLKKSGNKYKILGDAENLPFKNNIFDFVLSFTLLQNLPGFKVFKEVERILKPDSLFILTTLKKKYMKKVYKILEKNFLILKEIDCGEDIGFICRKTYK